MVETGRLKGERGTPTHKICFGAEPLATREVEHRAPPAGRSLSFLPDEALARRVATGEVAAFEVLFERYRSPLFRFCRALLRTSDDAEEAFQATMTNGYSALRSGPPERLLVRPWLYRIARNAGAAVISGRAPMHDVVIREPLRADGAAMREMSDEIGRLEADLHTLSEPQRAALLLREMSGLPHEAVAEAMGMGPGEAKRLIHQARHELSAYPVGDDLSCPAVREIISAGDKRTLSSRHTATHLAGCGSCQGFLSEQERLRVRLAAFLPPVPALVSERVLAEITRTPSATTAFSEWGYSPWSPATKGESSAWPPGAPAPAVELGSAPAVTAAFGSGSRTAPEARRWAVVGGVAAAVALSAGALAVVGSIAFDDGGAGTGSAPAAGPAAEGPSPEQPAAARSSEQSARPPAAPPSAAPAPAATAASPAPRTATPIVLVAPLSPAPAAPAAPAPGAPGADRESAPPETVSGSGFESGQPTSRPLVEAPSAPGRDAPRSGPEPAPVPEVPPAAVPADDVSGPTAGSEVGGVEDTVGGSDTEPVDATVAETSDPPDSGPEPGAEPADRGSGPLDTPIRDIATAVTTDDGGLAGLPGLVISAVPAIGSRAGSALRDRDADPVREGESQGTGDLGIGGIKIGRPPTTLGAAAGLSVPARRPRTDTVLWTVPGSLFDLIRDPVRGFVRGDRSRIPTARVAELGWTLGGRLPAPPESPREPEG